MTNWHWRGMLRNPTPPGSSLSAKNTAEIWRSIWYRQFSGASDATQHNLKTSSSSQRLLQGPGTCVHQTSEEKNKYCRISAEERRFILVTKQQESTAVMENSDVSCRSLDRTFSDLIPADSSLQKRIQTRGSTSRETVLWFKTEPLQLCDFIQLLEERRHFCPSSFSYMYKGAFFCCF